MWYIIIKERERPKKVSRRAEGFPKSSEQQAFSVKYSAVKFGKEGESDGRRYRAAVFSGNVP